MAKAECGNDFKHARCPLAGTWPNCEASHSRNAACPHSAVHETVVDAMQAHVDAKRRARMSRVDAMPSDVRHMVHEYGLHVVNALLDSGVTRAKNMRHIVESILDEFSPTRCASSYQGPRALTQKAREMTQAKPFVE